MIGRLLVSLAAVLGVMWLLARRARKGMKGKGERVIEVLERTNLSRSSSVAVIRVNDQAFVLGVAENQVSILGETDLEAALAAKDVTPVRGRRAASHRSAPTSPRDPSPRVPARRVVADAADSRESDGRSRSSRPLAVGGRPVANRETQAAPAGALAGSALSPQTWKQTIESLRDLTSRT